MSNELDSILTSIKKLLGFEEDYEAFDTDLIIHINSAFATLHQLGVGPSTALAITDKSAQWSEFFGTTDNIQSVKTYVYLKVRLLFDPPETSYAREAFLKQANEYEWRLNVAVEGGGDK